MNSFGTSSLTSALVLGALLLLAGCGGQARVNEDVERARGWIAEAPRRPEGWAALAKALEDGGQPEAALEAYEEAMDRSSEDREVYQRAARLAATFGLFEDARVFAELGLYEYPEDRTCRELVARAYLSMGERERAKPHLAELESEPAPFRVDPSRAFLGRLRIKEDGSWVRVRTDAGSRVARYAARTADLILERYRAFFPGLRKPAAAITLFVFERKQDYQAMLERYHRRVSESEGLTTADSSGIRVIACLEAGVEYFGRIPQGDEWLNRILLHELAHVAALLSFRGGPGPPWMAEGYAEYLSGAEPRGPRFRVGSYVPMLHDTCRALVSQRGGELLPLERLLRARGPRDGAYYALAWSWVHFLHHGEGGRYAERFQETLERMSRGEGAGAFSRAFEGVPRDQLEAQWHAYVRAM